MKLITYGEKSCQGMFLTSPKGTKRHSERLTQEQNQLLEECAERLSTTKTEVINKGIALVKKELEKK